MVMISSSVTLRSAGILTEQLRKTPAVTSVHYKLVPEKRTTVNQSSSLATRWRRKWHANLSSKLEMILTPLLFILALKNYIRYLQWNETRTDVTFSALSDPILPFVTGCDFSVPLFFLAYGSILLGAVHAFDKPNLVLEFLQTKALVVMVRIVSLYLTPLDAPKDTILLVDPFANGDSTPLVRDLFFSGHTATTFVVFFTCRAGHWKWKLLFLCMGLITGAMVIVQKTHFVIDVWAAPFFVYACHRTVFTIRNYCHSAYIYTTAKDMAAKAC